MTPAVQLDDEAYPLSHLLFAHVTDGDHQWVEPFFQPENGGDQPSSTDSTKSWEGNATRTAVGMESITRSAAA